MGARRDTPTSRFAQTLVFERDFNSYCSYVRQAQEGAWLFRNQLTPERHEPAFFNLEFLAAGKLAALAGLSAGAALQVLRGAMSVLFVLAAHWLCCLVLAGAGFRWLALLVLTTGGGFGWLTQLAPLPQAWLPVDLYAGLHPFFWLLLHPHFLAAQLLSVVALACFFEGEAGGRTRWYAFSGLAATACGLARPYDLLQLQAAIAAYVVLTRLRRGRQGDVRLAPRLLPVLVPLPALAYQFWLFRFHPVFEWWGRLGVLPPPHPVALLLGLGLLLPVLLWTARAFARSPWSSPPQLLLGCCALTGLGLLYAYPLLAFSFQFVTTLLVPSVLFAAVGLERRFAARPLPGAAGRAALAALLLLNGAGSALLYAQKLREVQSGRHRIDGVSLAIFDWLAAHAAPGDVVMAAFRTSNRIPRFTPASVVAGYVFSTVDVAEKRRQQERFFDPTTRDVSRLRMIRHYGVRYVVHGIEERQSGYDPAKSPFLVEAFRSGDGAVYEVRLP